MAGIMEKKKKNSLFSAIKRIFSSKKETDKKKGIWGPSETRSLFPLFRGPSSIEKILGEADQLNIRPRLFLESPTTIEKLALGKSPTPPKSVSPRACSSNDPGHVPPELFAASSSNSVAPCLDPLSHLREDRNEITCVIKGSSPSRDPEPNAPECSSNGGDPSFDPAPSATKGREEVRSLDRYPDPEPDTLLANCSHCGGPSSRVLEGSKEISSVEKNASATKIQAAYRAHLVRRSYRASKGLARLQRVMRGQNVRRQTVSAIKQVQLHVRVQRHIQSQRKKVLENQTLKHQSNHTEKDTESRLSKRTLSQILSESTGADDWNDSLLTKEEEEAQLHKKAEAVMKRERAMAYAYSHQLSKNQKLVDATQNLGYAQFPWSWNWFSNQLAVADASQSQKAAESVASTPLQASSETESSTRFLTRFYNHRNLYSKSGGSVTPQSTKSAAPLRPTKRNPLGTRRFFISRASPVSSAGDAQPKDDDSHLSCPPFSRPHYMTPTISALAKARGGSNPKERLPGTADSGRRRFSLPFTPDSRNLKWKKGEFGSQTGSQYQESPSSNKSYVANSTVSMPAFVGRKPFNRFV